MKTQLICGEPPRIFNIDEAPDGPDITDDPTGVMTAMDWFEERLQVLVYDAIDGCAQDSACHVKFDASGAVSGITIRNSLRHLVTYV